MLRDKGGKVLGYITIDTGTTNTRVRYFENDKVLWEFKEKIGVRDTAITGNLEKLKECIKTGITNCLLNCGKKISDVNKIIASGMITSDLGLLEIPHLETPIGIEDLRDGVKHKVFKDIVDAPIYFIPGVKNRIDANILNDFDAMDMMRGEESEALGALYLSQIEGNVIYISPGSHTKFVFIDYNKRITKCSTTLTGELLWALANETVLASSIPSTLISNIDKEYIMRGIAAVKKHGFSKTCFLTRIIDVFTNATANQRANFIAGAICYYDIKSIEDELLQQKPKIVIGGSKILRKLYRTILEIIDYDLNTVYLLEDDLANTASSIGAIKVIEKLHI